MNSFSTLNDAISKDSELGILDNSSKVLNKDFERPVIRDVGNPIQVPNYWSLFF